MKKKGFTLMELLAVIVIIAIITIMAVPIIIKIISNSKETADTNSVSNYAEAIRNSVSKEALKLDGSVSKLSGFYTTKDKKTITNVNTNEDLRIDYEGIGVTCQTIQIKQSGGVYLENCFVKDSDTGAISYGTRGKVDYSKYNAVEGLSNLSSPTTPGSDYCKVMSDGMTVDVSSSQDGSVLARIYENTQFTGDPDTYTVVITGNGQIKGYAPGPLYYLKKSDTSLREKITNVVIEEGITNIPTYAFYTYTNMTSITIPNTVTTIDYNAFFACQKLKQITLPSSLQTINSSAFSVCTSLTSITIPSSVTYIGGGVFSGCTNLGEINYKGTATGYPWGAPLMSSSSSSS